MKKGSKGQKGRRVEGSRKERGLIGRRGEVHAGEGRGRGRGEEV